MTFAIDNPNDHRGASSAFIGRHKKFRRYLEEGDLVAAEDYLRKQFEESGWNLYETTWLWILSYRLHAARSDMPNQLKSISRAAAGRNFLAPDDSADILEVKFLLEAHLGRYAEAIETYERLVDESPKTAEEDRLTKVAKSIYEYLNSDKALATTVLIEGVGGDGVWAHRLTRHKFAIDSVDGKIENLDIRCDWHRARDLGPFADKIWEIPATWGDCRLFIHGGVGTSLRLLELSDK